MTTTAIAKKNATPIPVTSSAASQALASGADSTEIESGLAAGGGTNGEGTAGGGAACTLGTSMLVLHLRQRTERPATRSGALNWDLQFGQSMSSDMAY